MNAPRNRRVFLMQSSSVGVGLCLGAFGRRRLGRSANERLNIGVIGVGGQGATDLNNVASENIAALCDVNEKTLGLAAELHPKAKRYHDFRQMLEQRDLDAVTVSTPDHTHAVAVVAALQLGKHVYCQKPLTHSIHEARAVKAAAVRAKTATQMGNQGHSNESTRVIVETLRAGTLGAVSEIHAWTDRPIWPRAVDRPRDTPPIPNELHWDLWLGPAQSRPYNPAYQPFLWRGWWDFGTGALGDMACHLLDASFWALDLRNPASIEADCDVRHPETGPNWSVVTYRFPARNGLAPLTLTWYDGGRQPSRDLVFGRRIRENGVILVGEKGTMFIDDPYNAAFTLLPEDAFQGVKPPAPTLSRSPGHYFEWLDACKTGEPTGSNFDYAADLTETVLLGNLAVRLAGKIEWDAAATRASNRPEADPLIKPKYRRGWSL